MICPACQTELPTEAKFCNVYGEKLELDCPECNKANPPGSRFCLACGHKLADAAETPRAAPSAEAERKQVTALFSDLSGYTSMTERLDPEEVKEITGRIFDGVRAIVGKYDGFIERFAGDGVLALFGVPKSHEDDPIRAIRAAREIHELVEGMNPVYESKVGARLSMHSGINTGLAVTADVDPEKGTHGVTGDAINIAARLSDLAKAGDILIGPATCRQAEGHFALEALEPTKLKGKSEPISVYRVLSLKEEPITVHRQSGLRAALIGRRAELAQLCEAVERLKGGTSSVISICGDAGTGKSRLVEEFKASLDLSKIRWREGHSYPYAQNIPYFPLMDLMSRAWRIEESDPPERIREKIESGVERLLGTRENVAPYVGSLYSLRYPEIEEVSPEFWKSRLFESIKSIVAALTQHAPTIFCFEDIHWADPSTLELLRFLVSDPKYPALFVCVHRLPFSLFSAHQLNALANLHEEIRLQDLSPSDTLDMVESLLKADSIPGELRKFIQNKVEGNPFYIEEAMNSLIQSGTLSRDNGSWKLTRPLNEADIPPTVQGLISARLDRLEKEMKRILQEASVIGRAFLHDILRRVTALEDSLDRSLRGLEMLDLVRVRSLQPDLEYIFKHALTQEVVYNGLLKKDRREIHERIGLVMEQLFRDRLSEFYEALAFHFMEGRSTDKAVQYMMKSAEKSLRKFALAESHQHYRKAYELVSRMIETGRGDESLLIDLLNEWAFVYYYLGDFGGILKLFEDHEELARSLSDKAGTAMFLAWLGWSLSGMEHLVRADRVLCEALEIAEEIQDHRVMGLACAWLTFNRAELGRMDEAIEFGRRAQQIYRSFGGDQYVYFKSGGGIAVASYYKGDRKTMLAAAEDMIAFGEIHGNLPSSLFGRFLLAGSTLLDGDMSTTIELAEQFAREKMDHMYYFADLLGLGMAYLLNGQPDKARLPLEVTAHHFRTEVEWEYLGAWAEFILAVVWIAEGRMGDGMARIEELRKQWLEHERRYFYTVSEYLLGMVYLQMAQGEGDLSVSTLLSNLGFLVKHVPFAGRKAERHFTRAIDLGREIGAKAIVGQAYLNLGRFHKSKGRKEKAAECLSKSVEIFQECHIETYLKQAEEELESLG